MAREMGPEEEIARQEACKKNIEKYIESLGAKSGCKIDNLPDGRTEMTTKEGEKYYAETLKNPEDPRVEKSHDFLEKRYGEDEVDSLETTKTAIAGKVVGDEESADIPLRVTAIESLEGKFKGTAHYAVLEGLDEDIETGKGKSFLFDAYREVAGGKKSEDLELASLGHDLEQARLMAEREGKTLEAAVVEADGEDASFYDKAGFKKCFIETQDGKMTEVPYVQSVLADNWNKKTGLPKKGEKPVPEHLMMAQLDGRNEITHEELLERVRAIMSYDSFQTEGYFKGDQKAFAQHQEILEADLETLENFLAQAKEGRVKLLSSEDLKALNLYKEQGLEIVEHTKADEER